MPRLLSQQKYNEIAPIVESLSKERQELSLRVAGTQVFLDVQRIGGGDIHYNIAGTWCVLDCTTGAGVGGKATVEIPQASTLVGAEFIQRSIVYVALSEQTGLLELYATTATPTGAYAPVAIMGIHDYTTITTIDDALIAQRTTESTEHNGKGAMSWMREKMRAMGALYYSGIESALDITTHAGALDEVKYITTNGEVFQLHRQNWPDYDTSIKSFWVANASGAGVLTEYQELSNIGSILETVDGTALVDGDSFVLTVWGAINYNQTGCKLFINLPKDKYTVDADAVVDKNNTAITRIPYAFKTVGFPIAQLVLKHNTAASGTWTNLLTPPANVWTPEAINWSTPNYPNNYGNNENDITTYTRAGADALRIHFDVFNTEANYDFVTVRNATDPWPASVAELRADPLSYSGGLGAFTSAEIPGDTLRVRVWTDGSVVRPGSHGDTLERLDINIAGASVNDIR